MANEKQIEAEFTMTGAETSCPKCGLEFKELLHPFCTHKYCPPRELSKKNRAVISAAALAAPEAPEQTAFCNFPHCDCSMGSAERCQLPAAPEMSEEASKTKVHGIREKMDAFTLAQQESFRAWSIAKGYGNPYQQLEAAAFERGHTAGRVEGLQEAEQLWINHSDDGFVRELNRRVDALRAESGKGAS
jgi:hypothetical protein